MSETALNNIKIVGSLPANKPTTSAELQELVVKFSDDIKAQDIHVHDFCNKYYETDYMVTCSGMSTTHVMSISERVEMGLKRLGIRPLSIEGRDERSWILMDYGSVVVHIMEMDKRRELDLDGLFIERLEKLESRRKGGKALATDSAE